MTFFDFLSDVMQRCNGVATSQQLNRTELNRIQWNEMEVIIKLNYQLVEWRFLSFEVTRCNDETARNVNLP